MSGVEKAIEELGRIASYDSSVGGYGSPPSLEVRIEAVRSLGSYVPHPKAMEILTEILRKDWINEEIRKAAAQALRNK